MRPIDISKGEQFYAALFAISPNNRMPAIVDPAGPGGRPISVFEFGAILQYLGPQDRQVLSARGARARRRRGVAVLAGRRPRPDGRPGQSLPPGYAPEAVAYAITRYTDEVNRLFGVMNTRLAGRQFLAGRYSIADMASVGWVRLAERMGQDLALFQNPQRWFETIRARPAVNAPLPIPAASKRPRRSTCTISRSRGIIRPAREYDDSRMGRPGVEFVRVQACALQISPPSTQPLSCAVLAPVMANEPE